MSYCFVNQTRKLYDSWLISFGFLRKASPKEGEIEGAVIFFENYKIRNKQILRHWPQLFLDSFTRTVRSKRAEGATFGAKVLYTVEVV